jgi:hypothetical protein
MKSQKRAYMGEPDYGNAEPMNTSRMATNRGTTDNPNKSEGRGQASKDNQKQSGNDTLKRLKEMKEKREQKERKRGAGREDMMSKQRQDTIMRREEEKKKKSQGMGGSTVVG